MYTICLSEDAKEELCNKKEKEIVRINNTIEDLMKGLWQGGTRVKKLHAVNRRKCIYEARVDKARRILFSVQRTEGYINPLVFVYNLAVEHNKVIRTAQAILGEDYDERSYEIDEKNRKAETIETLLNSERLYYPEQNQVLNIVDDSKFYEFTDDDLLRILYKENITEEELIDFKLRLTKEQKDLINKPLPMLIAGTAGSGKTTILIYKLLNNPLEPKLYITYNDKLSNEAKNLFKHLVRGMDNEQEYIKNTHFTTFEKLTNKFYKNITKTIMTKERFINEYLKYGRGSQLDKKFPPLMAWEELRGVWKTNVSNTNISLTEYMKLPREEAPNFSNNRKEAYKIYEWYENYLKDSYVEDELDLLRGIINSDKNININYSMIVCDEVQDLTRLHLLFLFKIASNIPSKLLIAGDDHQIINHSGFRWENIKNLFYNELNKSKVELYKLNKNFRCDGNVSNLANCINELQKDFIDVTYKTKSLSSKIAGEKPTLVYDVDDKVLIKHLKNLGPTQAIIVKDSEEQKELKQQFNRQYKKSPLIFTIEESKGLEFELIVLWKLVRDKFDSNEDWKKIYRRREIGLDNNLSKFVRYQSSLLYVAITRAIKECIIYDGELPGEVWTFNEVKDKLKFDKTLAKFKENEKRIFTALEWFNQGKKLFTEELYSQAIDCLNRVHDDKLKEEAIHLEKICEARILASSGELEQAGELYKSLSMIDEAEKCFDGASLYDKLIDLFGTYKYGYKNVEKTNTYYIKKFDSIKEWNKSAIYCKQKHMYEDAIIRFKRAEKYKDAAIIEEFQLGNYQEALELYKLDNDPKGIDRCKYKLNTPDEVSCSSESQHVTIVNIKEVTRVDKSPINNNNSQWIMKQLIKRYDDEFWKWNLEQLALNPDKYFIRNNHLYSIGNNEVTERGFSGQKFNFKTISGKEAESSNVWDLGELPGEVKLIINKFIGELVEN